MTRQNGQTGRATFLTSWHFEAVLNWISCLPRPGQTSKLVFYLGLRARKGPGTATNMTHYGRCARGQRLVAAASDSHCKITTFGAGSRHNGIVAPLVLNGPILAHGKISTRN